MEKSVRLQDLDEFVFSVELLAGLGGHGGGEGNAMNVSR